MKKDLERIRKMAAEGTISPEQAEKLLASLGAAPAALPSAGLKPSNTVTASPAPMIRLALAIAGVVLLTGTGVLAVNNPGGCAGAASADPACTVSVLPDDQVVGQGEMVLLKDGKKLSLPLRHTAVQGTIEGTLARVTVQQRFINVMTTPIEAVYTFPLPQNAAVDSMVMAIGDRRIRGIIKEKGEARAIYEQARREGKTASLLEQERPNIFTQNVANIMPGDTIDVTISYVEEVAYRDGVYQVVFPMVVGPRYIPGTAIAPPQAGGTVGPTTEVIDADRITPAIVPKGMRSGHDISLSFDIRAGKRVSEVNCESHRCTIAMNGDSGAKVSINAADNIPNKDFILRYRLAEKTLSSLVLTHADKGDSGWFLLTLLPQMDAKPADIVSRELVFVVDNSGSMMGQPVAKCRDLMREAMEKMRPGDVFRIMSFAGSTRAFRNEALPATEKNIKDALAFIDNMQGSGGTEMMSAIKALYELPDNTSRKRLILFMTDGYVGNEDALVATARERLGRSRVFTLGVGSSVNHYLLESLASVGRGEYRFIRQDGDADATVREFYTLIDAPVLTDISIQAEGAVKLCGMVPRNLPDLFAGSPLQVVGRYCGRGAGEIRVSGMLPGGKTYEQRLDVSFAGPGPANAVVKTLWARRSIKDLKLTGTGVYNNNGYIPDTLKEAITKIALDYKIMSEYTSFVAVDERVRNENGQSVRVDQPVDMPEGVDEASQPTERFANAPSKSMPSVGRAGSAMPMQKMMRSEAPSCPEPLMIEEDAAMPELEKKDQQLLPGIAMSEGAGSPSSDRKVKGSIGFGAAGAEKEKTEQLKVGPGSVDTAALAADKASPKPAVGSGILSISGVRTKASVERIALQNNAALRDLFTKALKSNPALNGKLTLKFLIDDTGKIVSTAVVSSTLGNASFEKSIVEKIQKWVFGEVGKKGDVTEVIYEFVFAK